MTETNAARAVVEEAVIEIAETLRSHARPARDGVVFWCHPARSTDLAPAVPLGPHLYAGTLGCALFFAALARVLDHDAHRDLVLRALAPLRSQIRSVLAEPERTLKLQQPVGGLTGLGSLVYGLLRIGDLLDDPSLTADAHLASALLTRARIDADEHLDVMTGSAGALLALLALDRRRPEENSAGSTPLELGSLCAAHILRTHPLLLASDAGGRSDRSPGWRGFCHGTSGICTALLRLHARTGRPELWSAAATIFRAERQGGGDPFGGVPNSWCKGAPGVALCRIEALGVANDPQLLHEAEEALAIAGASPLEPTDDLCCGNAGRLEALVFASNRRAAPDGLGQAFELAGRVLERARRTGGYSQPLPSELGLDLRLFPGLAGIGYSLLRLLEPELPSVSFMS